LDELKAQSDCLSGALEDVKKRIEELEPVEKDD